MSDVVTLARTARESLARGLNALQGYSQVPPQLLELAAPIAQAMGALHQIERSGGAQLVPNAQHALANVQHALAQLQGHASRHPAVLGAAEAVAGALGNVHALTRIGQPGPAPAAAPLAPLVPPVPLQATSALRAPGAPHAPAPGQPAAYAPGYAPPAAHGPVQGGPTQPVPQAGAGVAPGGRQPATRTAPTADRPQSQGSHGSHGSHGGQGGGQGAPAGARPLDVPIVTAELGAHSPSNFYKGLSGNDIVEHGGLFVSTYKLPKLGQPVRLKIALPGGYEFEANAVVRWRREANDAGSDAPPGFGAQFTEITTEARQLVYRYVRNREPMFHDDL